MFGHESLENYYTLNFKLMQLHGYSLSELENLYPFEREIYIALLIKHQKDEAERIRQKKAQGH